LTSRIIVCVAFWGGSGAFIWHLSQCHAVFIVLFVLLVAGYIILNKKKIKGGKERKEEGFFFPTSQSSGTAFLPALGAREIDQFAGHRHPSGTSLRYFPLEIFYQSRRRWRAVAQTSADSGRRCSRKQIRRRDHDKDQLLEKTPTKHAARTRRTKPKWRKRMNPHTPPSPRK
jgi:hypothetical protein